MFYQPFCMPSKPRTLYLYLTEKGEAVRESLETMASASITRTQGFFSNVAGGEVAQWCQCITYS